MANVIPIPEDTTLKLTRPQWIALKALIEFVEPSHGPFVYSQVEPILEQMGGYSGLGFGGLNNYPEYRQWYEEAKNG